MAGLDPTLIGVTIGFTALLGLVLAGILAFANRKLWVFEDPRIDEVEKLLPASNCGACGTAGCRPFAELLVRGEIQPAKCTVSSANAIGAIADFLGVDAGEAEKRVARLACAGGEHVARMQAHYEGLESCRAAALLGGGPKSCAWGCLGFADCERACDFDAITMDAHRLPVVDSCRCTACGDCVEACPKELFSLQPVNHRLWVACRSLLHCDDAEALCEVACTGCEKCARDAAPGLIEIRDNLARIDYSRNSLASPDAIQRCPTGAIVWLDDAGAKKGAKAKRIVREEPLPVQKAAP